MKKKLKKKMFFIERSVFPGDILVCFNSNRDEIKSYIKKHKKYTLSEREFDDIGMDGGDDGRAILLGNGNMILRMMPCHNSDTPDNEVNIPTLVHELAHIVHFTFSHIGYTVKNDNDEIFAYYQGYLMEQILEKFKDNGRTKSKTKKKARKKTKSSK